MRMDEADISAYGKLASYVERDLPEVLKVPRVVSAYRTCAGMDFSDLKIVFGWGYDPLVRVDSADPGLSRFAIKPPASFVEDFNKDADFVTARAGRVHELGVFLLIGVVGWRLGAQSLGTVLQADIVKQMNRFQELVYGSVLMSF